MRVLRLLAGRWRVLALTSSPQRRDELRAAGAVPLFGDLDDPATLGRLAALADAVLHLAPPPPRGAVDSRTRHLLQALARRRACAASSTAAPAACTAMRAGRGSTRPARLRRATDRARRRVDAEQAAARSRPPLRRARLAAADPGHLRARPAAAIRASGCCLAGRCCTRPRMSTPTTSMPTTWRAPASRRCSAACRSAQSMSVTTASC